MSDNQPILIIGGTRGTGLLIARLLERHRFPIRVLARNPDRARMVLAPNVHVLRGDITKPETLPLAIEGVGHIIFTAGCRSGHPATEARIKATEYEGVRNALAEARRAGFSGRFLYMTASGVARRSLLSACLNLYKGNTLLWRLRAEAAIRESSIDYTIIRAGMLVNHRSGRRAIRLTQEALPLSLRHRIGRSDVAEVFVAALCEPHASHTTFEVVWTLGQPPEDWRALLKRLQSDNEAPRSDAISNS
jgi:uncharacterized protein YbjT (DUF2867 family)